MISSVQIFNVDHLLVGPEGIFVIETKTISKPTSRDAVVQYDPKALRVDGVAPDRDPIRQAYSEAQWVAELIAESSGRTPFVRAVVLYPGWFVVDQLKSVKSDVWVLSARALPDFIQHEPRRLGPEDIKLISFHLSRYMRSEIRS